jgi:hypothetical protein
MPQNINANATQVASQSGNGQRWAVASITSATPCVVTTSLTSSVATGDTVRLEGTLHADGLYTVTAKSGTAFALNGTTAATMSAQASAQGYATDLAITPQIQIISDLLDNLNSANIGVGTAGLNNYMPWLYERTGQQRIYRLYSRTYTDPFPSTAAAWSSVTNVGLNTLTLASDLLNLGSVSPAPCWAYGDLLEVRVTGTIASFSNTTTVFGGQAALFLRTPSGSSLMSGSSQSFANPIPTTGFSLAGFAANVSGTSTFAIDLQFAPFIGSGGQTIALYGGALAIGTHYRANT